jgi:hypothetical protein
MRFVGRCRKCEASILVVAEECFSSELIFEGELGPCVIGELFVIDDPVLECLNIFQHVVLLLAYNRWENLIKIFANGGEVILMPACI